MSKLFIAAALGLALLPVGATAQSYQPDLHVTYADLDLASPAGARELDLRIAHAVSAICENQPHVNSLWQHAVDRCRKLLTSHVEPQRQRVLASRGAASTRVASAK